MGGGWEYDFSNTGSWSRYHISRLIPPKVLDDISIFSADPPFFSLHSPTLCNWGDMIILSLKRSTNKPSSRILYYTTCSMTPVYLTVCCCWCNRSCLLWLLLWVFYLWGPWMHKIISGFSSVHLSLSGLSQQEIRMVESKLLFLLYSVITILTMKKLHSWCGIGFPYRLFSICPRGDFNMCHLDMGNERSIETLWVSGHLLPLLQECRLH